MRLTTAVLLVVGFGVFASNAQAQLVGDDVSPNVQASWNTASAGTMAFRAPGNLVTSARSDFITRQNLVTARTRSGPTIDEPMPGLSIGQQLRIDVMNTLFTNLNAALVVLNNAIRLNAGLDPQLPDTTGGLSDLLGNISGPS